jgi:4-hydroxybenzoate polyprenyltransferase
LIDFVLDNKEIKYDSLPLCVDLDGTLIATDTLLESTLAAVKLKPLILFLIPFWVLKGKVYFKNKIAGIALPNPETLPYREDVLEYLKQEKAKGREIVLATATVKEIADSVAEKLGIFDKVLGSGTDFNLRDKQKLQALKDLYGEKGFIYAGDSKADIDVWKGSAAAILVNANGNIAKKAEESTPIYKSFQYKTSFLKSLIKEIRVYQWIKNILIFLPLLLAHNLGNADIFVKLVIAFFSFSFVASFVYIINDLLDLEADRLHPRKKNRPLASGAMHIKHALLIAPALLLISILLSVIYLPLEYNITLLAYFVLTTAYSFYLKRIYLLDIMLLSGLYTIRLVAGSAAVAVFISPWLLALSIFLFFSLATIKRYTELKVMIEQNKTKTKGRGYFVDDLSLLLSFGPSSGLISVLIFILYINSNEVIKLYDKPQMLLPIAGIMMFWILRLWFMAHRGKMTDDPIVYTAKDPVSYVVALLISILAVGASI